MATYPKQAIHGVATGRKEKVINDHSGNEFVDSRLASDLRAGDGLIDDAIVTWPHKQIHHLLVQFLHDDLKLEVFVLIGQRVAVVQRVQVKSVRVDMAKKMR